MNVGEIKTFDVANGIGIRVTVFVSGCTNHCKGCFQPQTWDFGYGDPYTEETETFILRELKKPQYRGLTLLGGEPFEPENQKELVKLVRRVKQELPNRDIWAFTGFLYDKDLAPGGCRYTDVTDEMLDCIDILVDGPFIEEKRNLCLKFRGSENQRIIDLKESRRTGTVVLSPLNN